jgi:hypothetical protein
MKLKKMLVSSMVLLSLQSLSPAFSTVPTDNIDLITQRYLEAIEAKAEYKARKDSLEGELLYLRVQNIALFLVVGYMAVNK